MALFWRRGASLTSRDVVAVIEVTTIGPSERVLSSLR
jgi:hypothetical protein